MEDKDEVLKKKVVAFYCLLTIMFFVYISYGIGKIDGDLIAPRSIFANVE